MTDDSHMGSDLPPIDPSSLNWVRYWYPIARKGLLVAGLITVLSAIGSMGFLVLHWRTSSIRELIFDRRISVLEVQAKKAEADLVREKANIADADARAAGADAEAKRATERASAFEADTAKAQERIATLEKEAAAAKAAIADADARAAEAQSALERAKSDRADADARAAGADAEAKRATASALGPTQLKHRNALPHWRKKPPPLSCRRPVLTRERPRHNQHHRNSKSRGY